MRHLNRLASAAVALAVATTAGFAQAQEASKAVKLFNGKDMTGWTYHLRDKNAKMEDVWSVKDGVIICKGNPAGYIRTEKSYTNYELRVQWRWAEGKKAGNSGVLLRMVGEDKVWPKSIEAQLMNQNAGDIWNIEDFPAKVDKSRTKGRRTAKLEKSSEKPIGEWNQYRIVVHHGKLELYVNDVLQNSATDVEEVAGKICLQSEGAEIHFRNVELIPHGN